MPVSFLQLNSRVDLVNTAYKNDKLLNVETTEENGSLVTCALWIYQRK